MFALLDALERHDGPVNLKQLAAETSLHASTVHRILSVLAQNRMVERVGRLVRGEIAVGEAAQVPEHLVLGAMTVEDLLGEVLRRTG